MCPWPGDSESSFSPTYFTVQPPISLLVCVTEIMRNPIKNTAQSRYNHLWYIDALSCGRKIIKFHYQNSCLGENVFLKIFQNAYCGRVYTLPHTHTQKYGKAPSITTLYIPRHPEVFSLWQDGIDGAFGWNALHREENVSGKDEVLGGNVLWFNGYTVYFSLFHLLLFLTKP